MRSVSGGPPPDEIAEYIETCREALDIDEYDNITDAWVLSPDDVSCHADGVGVYPPWHAALLTKHTLPGMRGEFVTQQELPLVHESDIEETLGTLLSSIDGAGEQLHAD